MLQTQCNRDARQEFFGLEGLADVIVRAQCEAAHFYLRLVARRKKDYWRVARQVIGFNQLARF